MADQKVSLVRRQRQRRFRRFNRALWRKWSKYTISGLLILLLGLLMIAVGIVIGTGSTVEILLIGFGAIIVLVGILRLLIGFINPSSPDDLIPLEENPPNNETRDAELQDMIFADAPADEDHV